MLDELMEEYQTIIETPPISEWRESEKAFGYIILDIVETRHKDQKIKDVPLEDIKIQQDCFVAYTNYMQEIAKMRAMPGIHPLKIAKDMLGVFCQKGELKSYIDGVYQLTKSGALYKGLEKKLAKS